MHNLVVESILFQNQYSVVLQFQIKMSSRFVAIDLLTARNKTQHREGSRRFTRKPPAERSQNRSCSKQSSNSSLKEFFIKSPTVSSRGREKTGEKQDFFKTFASSIITTTMTPDSNKIKQNFTSTKQSPNKTDSDFPQRNTNLLTKIQKLQSEVNEKNHKILLISSECARLKTAYQQQKQSNKLELKKISKTLKQTIEKYELQTKQLKHFQQECEYLLKQVQFLEKVSYDETASSLQSYREKYLEEQIEKLKAQLKKSKGEREQELEKEMTRMREANYTIESLYKALKIKNQCLTKKLSNKSTSSSCLKELKKAEQKYAKCFEQYQNLLKQNWSLRVKLCSKARQPEPEADSIFNITASDTDHELSLLKKVSSSCLNESDLDLEIEGSSH